MTGGTEQSCLDPNIPDAKYRPAVLSDVSREYWAFTPVPQFFRSGETIYCDGHIKAWILKREWLHGKLARNGLEPQNTIKGPRPDLFL
jgi:hypothetical protein